MKPIKKTFWVLKSESGYVYSHPETSFKLPILWETKKSAMPYADSGDKPIKVIVTVEAAK